VLLCPRAQAWSTIVYSLIPNASRLEKHLMTLCTACAADELVLFERASFLVISQAIVGSHEDPHRFEKIANIIKQFKLACAKTQAQFVSMKVCAPAACARRCARRAGALDSCAAMDRALSCRCLRAQLGPPGLDEEVPARSVGMLSSLAAPPCC
jgi:hypothetical protein